MVKDCLHLSGEVLTNFPSKNINSFFIFRKMVLDLRNPSNMNMQSLLDAPDTKLNLRACIPTARERECDLGSSGLHLGEAKQGLLTWLKFSSRTCQLL